MSNDQLPFVAEYNADDRTQYGGIAENVGAYKGWKQNIPRNSIFDTFAEKVQKLYETQIEWNKHFREFTDREISKATLLITQIPHTDIKDPVLFLLACKVRFDESDDKKRDLDDEDEDDDDDDNMFDDTPSKRKVDWKKSFVWYTDPQAKVNIEPWQVYKYWKLLSELSRRESS